MTSYLLRYLRSYTTVAPLSINVVVVVWGSSFLLFPWFLSHDTRQLFQQSCFSSCFVLVLWHLWLVLHPSSHLFSLLVVVAFWWWCVPQVGYQFHLGWWLRVCLWLGIYIYIYILLYPINNQCFDNSKNWKKQWNVCNWLSNPHPKTNVMHSVHFLWQYSHHHPGV